MNNIGHRFFKEETTSTIGDGSIEDSLLFFIDNYNDFLLMYRVMEAQVEKTREKQEQAQKKLKELRDRLDEMKRDKKPLSEADKIENEAKTEYYTKMREETDIVYYKGEPMDADQVALMLIKYRGIFTVLERADKNFRCGFASRSKKVLSFILKPLNSCMKSYIKDTKKGEMKEALKDIHDIIKHIPSDFEDKVMSKVDIDLDLHIPKQKQFTWGE